MDVDPETGTPRVLMRLDGALSGPAESVPATVALRYAREHVSALGLSTDDLDGLRLSSRDTTPDGMTSLSWRQYRSGVPAFDNALSFTLDRGNRVIAVTGSPAHDLQVGSSTPGVTARSALVSLMRNVDATQSLRVENESDGPQRVTTFSDGSRASLVIFATGVADRLAWEISYQAPGESLYHAVIDAQTGRLLYRASATKFASNVSVFERYPGAPLGGTEVTRDIEPWLTPAATTLTGPNAHAYSDLNDAAGGANEEVPPAGSGFFYPFPTTFALSVHGACDTGPVTMCSWDNTVLNSWQGAGRQMQFHNAAQVFFYVNTFHDHLKATPIFFDANSGNFEGSDPVLAEADDGAATGPNDDHLDNANMSTPAVGSPTMQMYLFSHAESPFRDINGGDDAAIVYHEYTHGLSGRLVTTASGSEALNSPQSGAMGEAWSDWYAMDYLVGQNLETDTPGVAGEVVLGEYTDATANQIRSQAMDCPVTPDAACPGAGSAGAGGYTYGDFGKIINRPEVHADGEIWGETLWDLRNALGQSTAEAIVTGGMRASPPEPSFLDMRNAILAADTTLNNGDNRAAIWEVFRARGMGFFASSLSGSDTAPIEDFSSPPVSGGDTGTVAGRVTDAVSGLPVGSVPIGFGGHSTAPSFPDTFATTSGAAGSYSLGAIPVGAYPHLIAGATAGYDQKVMTDLAIGAGATTTRDFPLARDWAAAAGGGQIVQDFSPATDYGADGCGRASAIDQSLGVGWSSDNPDFVSVPAFATIKLPRAITVTSFGIDPNATCGDGPSATLRDYSIETSADGVTWALAKTGTFAGSAAGRLNTVVPTAATTNVRYVRIRLLSPQDDCPATHDCSGEQFIDLSEFEVYGAPPNVLPAGALSVPASATPGQTVTLDASSFTDPDSAITGYGWDFDGNGTVDSSTTAASTTFAYGAAGTYAPKVTVSDFRGGAGTATSAITVAAPAVSPPAVTPVTPVVTPVTPVVTPKKPSVTLPQQKANLATVRIVCRSACTGSVKLKLTQALAGRLHIRHWTIATRKLNFGTGTTTVRIAIKRSVLRKLRARRIRAAVFTLLATVTDTSRQTTNAKKSPRIPISKR